MGRWSPRPMSPRSPGRYGIDDLRDDVDELDEEPPAAHFQRQAAAAEHQLRHDNITDPGIRARLERDLAHWRTALARATIEQHWDTGAGDRPLF